MTDYCSVCGDEIPPEHARKIDVKTGKETCGRCM